MWIDDLVKAFWVLEKKAFRYNCCVERVHDNVITMTNGTLYLVPELVEEYERCHKS